MSNFETVRAIIADQLGIPQDSITMDSNLLTDLKADSLDIMELVMDLEKQYNTEVPDEVLQNLRTVRDIVEFMDTL